MDAKHKLDGDTFRSMMIKAGATDQILKTKTFQMAQSVVTDAAFSASEELQGKYKEVMSAADRATKAANAATREASETKRLLEEVNRDLSSEVISDVKARDALLLYRKMLEATVDVFGEERMTDAVICQAIIESGYGAWRAIMGGKFSEQEERRRVTF